MDPVFNAESSPGKTRKIVLVSIIAVLVGALVGALAMFLSFRTTLENAVFFNPPEPGATQKLSYPNPTSDQNAFVASTTTNIVLPKGLVGQDYFLLMQKIANELQQVGVSNISTLVPLMNTIKQKSISGDFNGFFDLITQAKNEIRRNTIILTSTRQHIAALRTLSEGTVKDDDVRKQTGVLLDASDVFVTEFNGYFTTLNETLSGSIPTQDLLDRLARQVTSVQNTGASMQAEFTALLTLMQQKTATSKP